MEGRGGMDHFLSGLEHGGNPWYAARAPVGPHGHEFAIGNSSFQLIPITSSNTNHPVTASNLMTYNTSSTHTNSQSAFRTPTEAIVHKVKCEAKDEEERSDSKTPSPSVALTPLSTNMAHHSHKAKTGERWDTKKVCNICGKVLSRGDKLKNHIRTHTNNYPFNCDVCGQGFLRSEGLRVHHRIHTGERPYVCLVCGKAYTRKDKLTRHAIVHTGQRPFVCHHCGKSFTRKDKMQRHEMIHKIDKPFTCVPCNLEFVRQETFNAHMERKHPERLPYTLVQQPRAGSPGYHPQGLNLADTKPSPLTNKQIVSTKSISTSTAPVLFTGSSSSSSSSSPSTASAAALFTGTSLASSAPLVATPAFLTSTSLLSGSSLLAGAGLPGATGMHHPLS